MLDSLQAVKSAFIAGDAGAVREALAAHPELRTLINEPLCSFDSPPITCVRSREMLDVLLEAGADINARSRWWAGGFGILDFADAPLAAYAIQRGATLTAHAAARLGMLDRLQEFIAADPTLVHARGGDGQTPLHFAATIEIAKYLLDHGADIDARDIDHESTPAQFMVRDRPEIARFLVSRGCKTDILMAAALGNIELVRKHLDADPASVRMSVSEKWFPKQNPRSGGAIYIWTLGSNKTPHRIAREFGHEDVLRLLMEQSPPELQFAEACAMGDEATAKTILERDPAIAQKLSPNDRPKLADAARDNNTAAVTLMLSVGWPVDARGQHDGTALHWASWHGNRQMVQEILRHSPALEDAKNEFHATPLGWTIHGSEHGWHRKTGDYASTVDLLCAAGASLPKDAKGTPAVKEVLQRYQAAKG